MILGINNQINQPVLYALATQEAPAGAKDGSNKIYTISRAPVLSCSLFKITTGGVITQEAFTLAKLTITMTGDAPISTDTLWAIFA